MRALLVLFVSASFTLVGARTASAEMIEKTESLWD